MTTANSPTYIQLRKMLQPQTAVEKTLGRGAFDSCSLAKRPAIQNCSALHTRPLNLLDSVRAGRLLR